VSKARRREFTLPNGVTVRASEENAARLFAGLDGIPAITREGRHHEAGEVAAGSDAAIDRDVRESRSSSEASGADLSVNAARENTLELRRAEEEIIMHLLMIEDA
jgi:hypothetical protein